MQSTHTKSRIVAEAAPLSLRSAARLTRMQKVADVFGVTPIQHHTAMPQTMRDEFELLFASLPPAQRKTALADLRELVRQEEADDVIRQSKERFDAASRDEQIAFIKALRAVGLTNIAVTLASTMPPDSAPDAA